MKLSRIPKICTGKRRRTRKDAAIFLLQRYGFTGKPGQDSWPRLEISFQTHEESGARLTCMLTHAGSPPVEWQVYKRLVDLRTDLHDPVKRELGKAKYAAFFKQVPFPITSRKKLWKKIMSATVHPFTWCIPWFTLAPSKKGDFASQLAEWCKVLASVVSFQDVPPQVALEVLHFLDAPVSFLDILPASPSNVDLLTSPTSGCFEALGLRSMLRKSMRKMRRKNSKQGTSVRKGTEDEDDRFDLMSRWSAGSFHTVLSGDSTLFESFSSRSSLSNSTANSAAEVGSWGETEVIPGPRGAESWPPARTDRSWSSGDFNALPVRDLNYSKLKKKVPSQKPLYDVVGIHILKGEQVSNAVKYLQPPQKVTDSKLLESTGNWNCAVPRVLVWNLQLPYEMWSPCKGCSMVIWSVATEETVSIAKDLETAPASIKLWASYLKEVEKRPESSNTSHLLKGIAFSENLEDMGLPWMMNRTVKSYNGKPVLVNQETTKILDQCSQDGQGMPEWVELSTDGRQFNAVSRKLVSSMLSSSEKARVNGGILIQGQENDELPEQLLMSFRIAHLDLCQEKDS